MKSLKLLKLLIIILLLGGAGFLALRILQFEPAGPVDPHGHDEHAAEAGGHDDHGADRGEGEEAVKGPHRGRLLTDGDFQVEVTIYEPPGTEPQSRVYFYENGKPLDPSGIDLVITLDRIDRSDTIRFEPESDYLAGDLPVVEPHSFDVLVSAKRGDRSYSWKYESYEGRVAIAPEAAEKVGIQLEKAGPAKLNTRVPVNGKIRANEEEMAHVMPRYPGVVKAVNNQLGDSVKKGDVLAVVESNDSLRSYDVTAEIDGTIIAKDVTLGEFVSGEGPIFVIADLATVWADFNVYRQDFQLLREGQAVLIDGGPGMEPVEATISYISPFGAENSQTMLARAVVPNPDGQWRPGLFVRGEVLVQAEEVPVAVKASAIQTFRDWNVVFINVGDLYEIMPVELGRRDADWVEVTEGLEQGAEYVTENSYLIKADILKSGASHDH